MAKYDKHGNWITSFGTYGTEPGQLRLPHSMQVDRKGNVYVADRSNRRIQVFDSDGNFLRIMHLNAPWDKTRHPVLGNLNPNRRSSRALTFARGSRRSKEVPGDLRSCPGEPKTAGCIGSLPGSTTHVCR